MSTDMEKMNDKKSRRGDMHGKHVSPSGKTVLMLTFCNICLRDIL